MEQQTIEMEDVVLICREIGLIPTSTKRQLKNGTLVFSDPEESNVKYGIYKSGYVRKLVTYGLDGLNDKSFPWSKASAMWQLNACKIEEIFVNKRHGGMYSYHTKQRILLPGDYKALAEIIVRVAQKSRKRNKK